MNDIALIENILPLLYKTPGNGISIVNIKRLLKLDDETTKRIVHRLRSDGICDENLKAGYGASGKLTLTSHGHTVITDFGSYSNYVSHLNEEAHEYNKIKKQEQKIRDMDEKLKLLNIIKGYWWLFGIVFSFGILLGKLLDIVLPIF